MRWIAIVAALLALVFVGAGCGGGSDEASTDTDAAVATDTIGSGDTSTDETSTDETSTDGTSTDDSGIDSSDDFNWASADCQNLIKAFVGLSAAIGAASSGQDVSGDVEEFAQYADDVPDEIKDDVNTIAAAYTTFLDELEGIGYTPGEIPTAEQMQQLQDASQSVGSPEVQAASDRLNTWTTENCSK